MTGDRDTLQLVTDAKIVVRTFNKGVSDTTIYDEKAVAEKYGLNPSQLIDYKSLVGDASDNVKGVPGVGPKTATDLLKKFGSLEKIYEALPSDPKLEKRFGPYRKEAELSGRTRDARKESAGGDARPSRTCFSKRAARAAAVF